MKITVSTPASLGTWSLAFAGLLAACGTSHPGEDPPPAESLAGELTTCKPVTVSGDVYYNDQRTYGRFPLHTTPTGERGRQYRVVDAEHAGASHGANYLSLVDATVEVYEIDRVWAGSALCKNQTLVGAVTTDENGHFSWSGTVCDSCALDDGAYETSDAGSVGVSLALRLVLRYCPDTTGRCFSVKEPPAVSSAPDFDEHDLGATQYAVWHGGAALAAPQRVFQNNATVSLDDAYFQAEGGSFDDKYLQAAYAFEGLAEATRRLHKDLGVPFRRAPFGEVTAIYPMKWANHGAGHSHEHLGADFANSLCLPAPGTESSNGYTATTWGAHSTVFHEYGHLVNYRAWEGYGKYVDYNYAACIDDAGDCTGEYDNEEYASAAFKEPWANFVKRVVLNEVTPSTETLDYGGCAFWDGVHSARSWDNDDDAAVTLCKEPIACSLGDRSPSGVEHALCDLFDDHVDEPNPLTFKGTDLVGDETLTGIITDLERTWSDAAEWRREAYIDASEGRGDKVKTGLGICELAARRVARVPADRTNVDNLMKKNGIDCDL